MRQARFLDDESLIAVYTDLKKKVHTSYPTQWVRERLQELKDEIIRRGLTEAANLPQ